ncbi:manganese catalase family protein [Tepidibacillus marianensis]|uniref:manganese catalase family protein n=1 Tax=Tepidibacillus marianensis TaxID=3131995 RepID=UPI0030D15800
MCPKENDHLSGRFRKYAVPGAYPETKVLKPNRAYAEILMDDYAGVVSEFTAINQYLYHHYFFDIIDNQLADLLEGVAVVEMYHLEILADLIILLGEILEFAVEKAQRVNIGMAVLLGMVRPFVSNLIWTFAQR